MAHIPHTWAQIGEHIADGSYRSRYIVGDTKLLDIKIDGKRTTIEMQIAAFDEDTLFDTGVKAPITWISKDFIAVYEMNPTLSNKGGWMLSNMRKYCMALYNNILDEDAQELIKPVRKTSYHYETNSSHTTKDYCWIPSMFEVFGGEYVDETGPKYTSLFRHDKARRKWDDAGHPKWWWLRSASVDYEGDDYNIYFCCVNMYGESRHSCADSSGGVVFGFCTSI